MAPLPCSRDLLHLRDDCESTARNPARSLFEEWLYRPTLHALHAVVARMQRLQSGSAAAYLGYILAVLLVLLALR